MKPKILAFSGSSRSGSLNRKLVELASGLLKRAGAEVTVLDLRDLALPLYDGDLEKQQGLPEGALRFKALVAAHHGVLVSTPEYNGYFPPLLKNVLDWASRPAAEKSLSGVAPFADKAAGLLAASPGPNGGVRALPLLRQQLSNLGMIVAPAQYGLGKADEAFDDTGNLKDPKAQAAVERVCGGLAKLAARLNS